MQEGKAGEERQQEEEEAEEEAGRPLAEVFSVVHVSV